MGFPSSASAGRLLAESLAIIKPIINGASQRSVRWRPSDCSFLGRLLGLLALLGLFLRSLGPLLKTVNLFDHESTGNSRNNESDKRIRSLNINLPVFDFDVGELASIRSGDSSLGDAHLLEIVGASDADSAHAGSLGMLFDVLDGELATGGSDGAEFVAFGPVGSSSSVGDSSIQHI